jgi:hypothetical protein
MSFISLTNDKKFGSVAVNLPVSDLYSNGNVAPFASKCSRNLSTEAGIAFSTLVAFNCFMNVPVAAVFVFVRMNVVFKSLTQRPETDAEQHHAHEP